MTLSFVITRGDEFATTYTTTTLSPHAFKQCPVLTGIMLNHNTLGIPSSPFKNGARCSGWRNLLMFCMSPLGAGLQWSIARCPGGTTW